MLTWKELQDVPPSDKKLLGNDVQEAGRICEEPWVLGDGH